MRAILTLCLLAAATPAAAQSRCVPPVPSAEPLAEAPLVPGYEDDAPRTPTPLSDLAGDSPWLPRFEAAADALLAALRSGDVARWQLLLGGPWLGAADARAVEALLADPCGAFAPLFAGETPPTRRILGWSVPASYSATERAEIAARPEAEALVCWSSRPPAEAVWPRTATEADNAPDRPYGCARIAYSLREGSPQWRAFIETPPTGF